MFRMPWLRAYARWVIYEFVPTIERAIVQQKQERERAQVEAQRREEQAPTQTAYITGVPVRRRTHTP